MQYAGLLIGLFFAQGVGNKSWMFFQFQMMGQHL
ncbi:Uncharacterised protein [Mycobacteroides abscessus]|nr:Uncharacterised protein [Mycobacteroides abscessus]